jgi:hypothetical protein
VRCNRSSRLAPRGYARGRLRGVPQISPVQKAQNAMPHDKRNPWLREQRRSPETPPRAAIQNQYELPCPLAAGLRLERPKACGTSIRQPVFEKIRVVRGPRGQMKEHIFHRELLTSLRLATGKAKRAAKKLSSYQQQNRKGSCWNFFRY